MRRLAVPALRLGTALAALAMFAGVAGAQAEPRRFSVGAQGGWYSFDKAAGLEDAAFAGIDATYHLPTLPLAGSRRLEPGIGFHAGVSLPTTSYDQFPVVMFDFGDTTLLKGVSQRVRLIEYGLQGSLATTLGRFRPYAVGGIGMWSLTVDPRQEGLNSMSKPSYNFGGGLNVVVTRTVGLRAEARNMVWTSFDRSHLDPTVAYTVDNRIRDVLPPPVPAKSTVSNLRFALVFSYVPGNSGAASGAAQGGTQ